MDQMMDNSIMNQKPLVRETPRGIWLATTDRTGATRRLVPIGVEGATEQEARERYAEALRAWASIGQEDDA